MDLEDLWAVEPSLRSGFYIQPISLLNHIETSKTVSNLYLNFIIESGRLLVWPAVKLTRLSTSINTCLLSLFWLA